MQKSLLSLLVGSLSLYSSAALFTRELSGDDTCTYDDVACGDVALTESFPLSSGEFYKTFAAPAEAQDVTFSFAVAGIDYAQGQKIYARVGDVYLHLTDALSLSDGASKDYAFQDFAVAATKTGSDVSFDISIPAATHSSGYIVAGIKSESGAATVTDVSMTMTCPEVCTYEEVCGTVSYDFETEESVAPWNFGKKAGGYMILDSATDEVYKAFGVPTYATDVALDFEMTEVGAYCADQAIYIRVSDVYLHVTSALSLADGASKVYTFGDYTVNAAKSGSTLTFSVPLAPSVYSSGYVVLGMKSTGSCGGAVAGIDNVVVDMTCPTFTDNKAGGGGGDPHFRRWNMAHTSFHGECDLVMVHSDQFHAHAGLDLHVRTTIQDYFSYIEQAVLRVGEHVLEFHNDHFTLAGVKLTPADLPLTFGDEYKYTVSNAPVEQGKNNRFYQYFKVDLHNDSSILFKFYKQYLTIDVSGNVKDFGDSVGLLGDYHTGNMIDRDGRAMHDYKEYGFEWQVNPTDGQLFAEVRSPQLPFEQCRMPTAQRPSRRKLRGGDAALLQEAKNACSPVSGTDRDLCINDVMSTGDVGLASIW